MENNLNIETNIKRQLFNLNNLSLNDLGLKWFKLYKTTPANLSRSYLIKGIAYKIQYLAGLSDTSDEELNLAIKSAKDRLKVLPGVSCNNSSIGKVKNVNLLPPAGSVIETIYKNKKYLVKVIAGDFDGSSSSGGSSNCGSSSGSLGYVNNNNNYKFEYDGIVYKSLSAIAQKITGTKWNGYTFFKLKKTMR